jgi:two-component sensor histidine kinase
VTLVKSIVDVELDLDRASVLGLIVTELITNAYTHAFPHGKGGIHVRMERNAAAKALQLSVSDNGSGFDHRRDTKRNGMKLVRMLVEQISGKLAVTSGNGSRFVINFPA